MKVQVNSDSIVDKFPMLLHHKKDKQFIIIAEERSATLNIYEGVIVLSNPNHISVNNYYMDSFIRFNGSITLSNS